MLEEIPGYEELQESVAMMARGRDILELGPARGRRRFASSREIPARAGPGSTRASATAGHRLTRAAARRPAAGRAVRSCRLGARRPSLGRAEKRDLFRRVGEVSDFFVLGDLVVAERPEDAVIGIDWIMDLPSTVSEQVEWLEEAGFEVEARYVRPDLAVFVARRQPASGYDRALRRKAPETGPSC